MLELLVNHAPKFGPVLVLVFVQSSCEFKIKGSANNHFLKIFY